jgi:hypothetical protein
MPSSSCSAWVNSGVSHQPAGQVNGCQLCKPLVGIDARPARSSSRSRWWRRRQRAGIAGRSRALTAGTGTAPHASAAASLAGLRAAADQVERPAGLGELEITVTPRGRKGPSGRSVSAIGKQLAVSGPALYRYFASRDELLAELVIDGGVSRRRASSSQPG